MTSVRSELQKTAPQFPDKFNDGRRRCNAIPDKFEIRPAEFVRIEDKLGLIGIRRSVSLNACATMSRDLDPGVDAAEQTRAHRYQKSLALRAVRWVRDVLNDLKVRRVFLVGLTKDSPGVEDAEDAIRQLAKKMRRASPGVHYIWWPEFQASGRLHWHMMVVNSRWRTEMQLQKWLDAHWPHSPLNQSVRIRYSGWFKRRGGAYAIGYAKKIGSKAYQQHYQALPRGWRVIGTHRLRFELDEHEDHEPRADVVWDRKRAVAVVVTVRRHCPAPGGCRLRRRRQGRQRAARSPTAIRFCRRQTGPLLTARQVPAASCRREDLEYLIGGADHAIGTNCWTRPLPW